MHVGESRWSQVVFLNLSLLALACLCVQVRAQTVTADPAKMPRIATVDERFQSYNIEMAEITGGTFWKPYGAKTASAATTDTSTPAGMDPNLYQYRPPIDLSNPRLRRLAAAIGPAYVRVSGTWANSVYFADSDTPPAKAPPGFSSVLSRKQWRGVVDFARTAKADIVTSVATSPGTRNADGVWTSKQGDEVLAYTRSLGGQIAAIEFMNEPTYAAMGGAPKGYDAAAYARDVAVFAPWLKKVSPATIFLGPGSVGEGPFAIGLGEGMLSTEELMRATGPVYEAFSYHLYPAASKRCANLGEAAQTTAADALTDAWLSRPKKIHAFYAELRDRYQPAKGIWITETADAACGGNPWASTFVDSFRFVIQHASLAQRGAKVIMHNTLAASDYGLLAPDKFTPRPNYWVTLIWQKLMGTTVLDPQVTSPAHTYTYAQCLKGTPGGVALLVINADRNVADKMNISANSQRYELTSASPEAASVDLNGRELRLGPQDALPQLHGVTTPAGNVGFPPLSITFLAIPGASNASCK